MRKRLQRRVATTASRVRSLSPVLSVLGAIVMVFAAILLLPLLVSWAMDDGALRAYPAAAGLALLCGAVLWSTRRFGERRELQPRDGMLLVSLVWTVLPAFAALPLWLHFQQAGTPMSFTDAYFEAVSGLTTTGATVISGLDQLPVSINLWRCFLQWLGGMGILVLMVAILPILGVGGSELFKAESAGPIKDNKITPRVEDTAKGLWTVYSGLSLLCLLAYKLGGMGWVDAWAHMFTTMSLGGLSTHDASFAHFKSPLLEWTCVVFMLIASCNFALYFAALHRRSFAPLRSNTELRGTLALLVGASLLIGCFLLWRGTYHDVEEAMRMAFFNTVSVGSTTGFSTTDYSLWPIFAPMLMIMLSGVATSAGSTGAGIKMVRAIILVKQFGADLVRVTHPAAVRLVMLDGSTVAPRVIFAILAFMLLYGGSIVAITLILIGSGLSLVTAFTAVMACINNMGPGLNEIGPAGNFIPLTDFQTWVCALTMVLGRLEVMSLLVLFTPQFWRR
jgi:trk system potassium uptake protein TrkH